MQTPKAENKGNARNCFSRGQREALAARATLMLKEFKYMHDTLQRDSSPCLVTQHFVCDLLEERGIGTHKVGTNTYNSSFQKNKLNTAAHTHAYILTERY